MRRRSRARWRGLAGCGMAFLAACSTGVGSIPGVYSTGEVRVLGLDPDVRECLAYEGLWLAVLGEGLGTADAWASGRNEVVFPPDPPGIPAEQVRLQDGALFIAIPDGAASGTMLVDVGTSGLAEIPLTVDGSGVADPPFAAFCPSNPPPGG